MLTGQTIASKVAYYLQQQAFDWIDSGAKQIVPLFSRGPAGDNLDIEVDSTPLPKIVVSVERADVTVPYSGGWNAQVTIELTSNADDTTAGDHDAHFAEIGELFMDQSSARDALSLLDGITVYMAVVRSQSNSFSERSFVSALTVEMECAEKAVPTV